MVSATAARNTLLALLFCTTSMYLAPLGKHDPGGLQRRSVREGYWGKPTGDFDWCEENYPFAESPMHFIAEPWNTFSNLAWQPLSVAVGMRLRSLDMLDAEAALGLVLAFMIGTGSFVFHATLLYEMQLVDELPMIGFVVLSTWVAYSRQPAPAPAGAPSGLGSIAAAAFAALFWPWLLLTPQASFLHNIGRVVMCVSFTACFISLGYSSTKMVEEMREVLPAESGDTIESVHTCVFAFVVCAILGWITDSVHCDIWQSLPYGLPYPQLHAMVWHNFMLIVVLGLILLQAQHRQVFKVCGGSKASLEKSPDRGRVIQRVLPFLHLP